MSTTNNTIVITGGGAGIGRGTAVHFLDLGWRVCTLDKDDDALAELRDQFAGDELLAIECDVGHEHAVAAAFGQISEWLGQSPLTVLVNNAAIADPYCGPMEELTLEKWQGWIDASLTSTFLCSRAAIPLLRRGKQGSIINMSSTRAVQSEPDTFAYAASKGGVSALTHSMAVSLGPDIRVNAVLPGWIETGPWQKKADRSFPDHREIDKEQHPVGRVGEVSDIARTVEWLVGEGAGFVTGQQIVVDGGMTRKMIYAG
ncbi:SDR family oxidoreductase [Altererythrobacter luteolus]|uniref:SDR family oxidoreductase n=1 Tax=Pontixanthobacter luteolus TaxID=295089 RepID=A0A6I4V1L5_9SPHN|nr:SDR family oxidoreductase [Pontixanthobacter luteolus]MXP48037.1 SDR family oxidoreductase [Pontixanthobacter luteolus]